MVAHRNARDINRLFVAVEAEASWTLLMLRTQPTTCQPAAVICCTGALRGRCGVQTIKNKERIVRFDFTVFSLDVRFYSVLYFSHTDSEM